MDDESGWAYNRYRYYHPNAGIYNAQDPLGLAPRTASAQGYVDHAANWHDYLGLQCHQVTVKELQSMPEFQKLDAMLAAIHEQTVSIAGAEYAELGVAMSATDALTKLEHRKEIEAQVLKLIQDIPQTEILLSMPGIGPRSAARILMTVGDMSDFPDAAHLASYAGLSPRTNQSGTSIMSNSPNRAGNKKLKNALWQSSFASIRFHERSRQFYERKRKEGKRHNAAVVALARRRLNVLFAMMRNGELYRDISTVQEAAAA